MAKGVQERVASMQGPADEDEDSNDGFDDELPTELTARFEGDMQRYANTLKKAAAILEYQIQFGEARALQHLDRQCRRAFDFFDELIQIERAENTQGATRPTTWGKNPATMFFYTRPPAGN
jgi:hypothetical protein